MIGEAETAVKQNDTPVTQPRPPSSHGSGARPLPPVPPPPKPTAPPLPSSGPHRVKPAIAVSAPVAIAPPPPPPPPPAPEVMPWDKFAAGATDQVAEGETTPTPPRSGTRHPAPARGNVIVIILVLAFVVIPIVLTGIITALIMFFAPAPPAP